MATRRITIDLEAYERLEQVQVPGETFGQTLRRLLPPKPVRRQPFDYEAWLKRLEENPLSEEAAAAIEEMIASRHRFSTPEVSTVKRSTPSSKASRRTTRESRIGSLTKRKIDGILKDIQKRLDSLHMVPPEHLKVETNGYLRDGDWLYVVVSPAANGVRTSQYVHALGEVEKALRKDRVDQVLLVPAIVD